MPSRISTFAVAFPASHAEMNENGSEGNHPTVDEGSSDISRGSLLTRSHQRTVQNFLPGFRLHLSIQPRQHIGLRNGEEILRDRGILLWIDEF